MNDSKDLFDGELLNVTFDEVEKEGDHSWWIKIAGKRYFFPFSICSLDEGNDYITVPTWLVVTMGLEAYAEEV